MNILYPDNPKRAKRVKSLLGNLQSLDDQIICILNKFDARNKESVEGKKWGIAKEKLQYAIRELCARRFDLLKMREYAFVVLEFEENPKIISITDEKNRKLVEVGQMTTEKADELLKEQVTPIVNQLRQVTNEQCDENIQAKLAFLDKTFDHWTAEDPSLDEIIRMSRSMIE
ncbi:hypothetical protein AMATHDRAFT_3320 [Amanita thiersii Skay4041]|uniref:Uncharacterized protein n=1 Tax=Amanita thiersii Skay4041 TaxID=703135 RepID=A0A2A9NS89_9AGAR|nr:hypothetical protein AMATHDRAFT_3320 [Amanita thiersii Skay4041]